MSKHLLRLALALVCMTMLVSAAPAQNPLLGVSASGALNDAGREANTSASALNLTTPAVLPLMSPEFALQTVIRRYQDQSFRLLAYTDQTVMTADLPDYKQRGEYELTRQYSAPNSLRFTPVRYTGDGFVKNNVLVRLLQSEVDHVEKQQGADTAITDANYKFSHKAVETIDGRLVYVFHVKPRKKRVGLFKGKIYVDPYRGELVRAEGEMAKSPSLFIKNLQFVQDYTDIGGFSLPAHLHSVAKVRIIGRTIVDIFHRDYKTRTTDGGQGTENTNTAQANISQPASN